MKSHPETIQSLERIYGRAALGVLLCQLDEKSSWQLLWNNASAINQFKLNKQWLANPSVKLELFSALKQDDPVTVKMQQGEVTFLALNDLSAGVLVTVKEAQVIDDLDSDSWQFDTQLDSSKNDSVQGESNYHLESVSQQADFFESLESGLFYKKVVEAANIATFLILNNEKAFFLEKHAFGILDLPANSADQPFRQQSSRFYRVDYEQLMNFIHPKDIQAVQDAFEELWEHHWAIDCQFRLRSKDHSYKWFQLKAQPFEKGGIGFLEDVNERVGFRRQLSAREKLIEQLIDGLPIGIVVKDAQSCYRFVNQQIETDFSLSRAEIIGKTDYELFNNPAVLQSVLSDKHEGQIGQLQIEEKSVSILNHTEWFMVGSLLMQVENMDAKIETWSMGFYLNITQRKLIEEELKEANHKALMAAQAKSDFLSIMSHEIRTPLNSVIGNAALLQDFDLGESAEPHVKMIHQSAEHLLYLINDILDFNKLEAGKVELEQQPLDLPEQLNACMQMSNSPAKSNQVVLQTQLDSNLPAWVQGDAGRLRQIVLNLVGNAIKFSQNGTVTLVASTNIEKLALQPELKELLNSVETENHEASPIYFVVRDTGIGIDAASIPKLFQQFSQATADTSRHYGGTGLGLAICKKLVEAMHGKIGISSEVGQGSDFAFMIPFQPVDTAMEYSSRAEVVSLEQKHRPLNILVAEDNQPNQFLIRAILKKLGHKVEVVNNGEEAVSQVIASQAHQTHYDIVLMDLAMPVMDGFSASKKIRQLQTQGDLSSYENRLPIVALTANALDEQKDDVAAAQMDDFLTKPIDIERLKQVLLSFS